MKRGQTIPPRPIRPTNSPCPIHSGHGRPRVDMVRPSPIINAPKITVPRVPTRSAIRPIIMPPAPEPSQATALASAGTERVPPTSLAISLRATTAIQAPPYDIVMMKSATEATTHDVLVSIEDEDCSIRVCSGRNSLTDRRRIDHCAELRSAVQSDFRMAFSDGIGEFPLNFDIRYSRFKSPFNPLGGSHERLFFENNSLVCCVGNFAATL